MSVSIEISDVVKKYQNNTVIKGLSLNICPGEFFTLLGPSGCGKTTLLRMIIGFNSIEGGTISIDGNVINDIPVNKRNMGMVFQNYAIFPHLSVAENVAFGLKQRNITKAEQEKLVTEILDVVKIGHLKDRMPTQLSGGQQQRVALARAIVIHPQVLLMDEPLSNLDAKLRVEMRNAIKSIQQKVGITTVYVTHDQEEALAVSDRIAVMNDGVIQQVGTPKHIYQRPYNRFVSNFIGLSNFFDAKLVKVNGMPAVDFGGYAEPMMNIDTTLVGDAWENSPVMAAVRPEEFIIAQEGAGIPAKVISSVFLGVSTHYFMELADEQEIEVITPSDTSATLPDKASVKLRVMPRRINVFNADGSRTLIADEDGEHA